jgi:glycerol kinase
MVQSAVLAIDEGTTNSKACLVNARGQIIASGSAPVPIEHPQSGWVQQDADAIWDATQAAIAKCLQKSSNIKISAIGISNQRESVLIWDRKTGKPLGPVITWQCRRTAKECEELKAAGHEADIIARTGLPIDPLFPPTKLVWLLKHSTATEHVCIGTIDSWLIWKLSGGTIHATDRSNAARTQLFNLAEGAWDHELCALFGIDEIMLPIVRDSSYVFGETQNAIVIPDGIPIASAIGDSHGALFGHGAFNTGDGKITFGTGSSVMKTVPEFITPPAGITTTIAWSINGTSTFAFEGNILVSASILPWTAKLLGLKNVDDLLELAKTANGTNGVSLVPALVGLASPHWNPHARGLISGLSFGSGREHLALAAAESMAFQVWDIFCIMSEAIGSKGQIFVDGGPSGNSFLMQLVANTLNHPVAPGQDTELSALGAAYMAGLATQFWPNIETISELPRHLEKITPQTSTSDRNAAIEIWRNAIARTKYKA